MLTAGEGHGEGNRARWTRNYSPAKGNKTLWALLLDLTIFNLPYCF